MRLHALRFLFLRFSLPVQMQKDVEKENCEASRIKATGLNLYFCTSNLYCGTSTASKLSTDQSDGSEYASSEYYCVYIYARRGKRTFMLCKIVA